MTEQQWEQLCSINTEVNAIPFNATQGPSEVDNNVWKDTPDDGSWVCRDYVVMKSKRLQEAGFSPLDLTVVRCYTELGEYHAVLAVRDGVDTFILDNRQPQVYRVDQPPQPYRWESRQIAGTDEFQPYG